MSKYIYQRKGGPIINWNGGSAPSGARAADARALGDCQCKDAARTPKFGAPEYISGYIGVGADEPQSAVAKIDDAVHSSAGRTVASAAMVYHGYKRSGSVGWALLWGALGYVAPVIAPVISAAQGFGHKKGG